MPVPNSIRFPLPLSPEDWAPVAVMLRCSSSQQELSVDDQWRVLGPYCVERRYRVMAIFVDEGRSASKEQEKRTNFYKMLRLCSGRQWRGVVCYDMARFTRQHNVEADGPDNVPPKKILHDNGMFLDTYKEGKFDFTQDMDRMRDFMLTESARSQPHTTSKDSIRGRLNLLARGYWPKPLAPWGYDREYTDGKRVQFVKRDEHFSKGRDWHLRLVINPAEAVIVREIFDLFVRRRWNRHQIAHLMTSRGLRPPLRQDGKTTGCWHLSSVDTILTDPTYIGTATLGDGRKSREAHNRIAPTEVPNSPACPRILADEHIWHEAQEILATRKGSKSRPKEQQAGLLSGFAFCGHCGYALSKSCPTRDNPHRKTWYSCNSSSIRKHLGCPQYRIQESILFPKVLDWLTETVDTEVMAALQESPAQDDEGRSADEALLGQQVAELEKKVQNATVNVLTAPPGLAVDPWAIVNDLQRELAETKQKLHLVQGLRSAPELANFRDWWEKAKADLTECKRQWEQDGMISRVIHAEKMQPLQEETVCCRVIHAQKMQPLQPEEAAEQDINEPTYRENVRALMGKLGLKAKVWVERNANKKKKRDLNYILHTVQIETDLDPASLSGVGCDAMTATRRVAVKRLFTVCAA